MDPPLPPGEKKYIKIEATEIKCILSTQTYSLLGRKRNEYIRREQEIEALREKIK